MGRYARKYMVNKQIESWKKKGQKMAKQVPIQLNKMEKVKKGTNLNLNNWIFFTDCWVKLSQIPPITRKLPQNTNTLNTLMNEHCQIVEIGFPFYSCNKFQLKK